MKLRSYRTEDCAEMAQLFYDTVHTVNARDYSQPELDAWATGSVDLEAWNRRYQNSYTLIAEADGRIVGFGNMDESGCLDMLYVHREHQREGVASAICDALEAHCAAEVFVTHASITAKPFFEGRGYRVVMRQRVELRGQKLTNFIMEKEKSR